ncbi:MAG TPA: hypothetical protein DDX06_05525 [Curvibacter sp.]|nr:hypothetical protein [Curvibacter sp.]
MTSDDLAPRLIRGLLAGLPGILILPWVLTPPPGVPVLALLINPLLLLLLAALAGAWAAPRVGLRSPWVLGGRLELAGLGRYVLGGLGLGAGVALLDHWLAFAWRPVGFATLLESADPGRLLLGVLYGGLTEEILMRWGLLSLLLLGSSRFLPARAAAWWAALVAALVFAVSHLPAVAIEAGGLTAGLLLRTLCWNLLLGLAFAVAALRQGLEAAMLMHGSFHLGVGLLAGVALRVQPLMA